jgi:tol-pal system protein YbgF
MNKRILLRVAALSATLLTNGLVAEDVVEDLADVRVLSESTLSLEDRVKRLEQIFNEPLRAETFDQLEVLKQELSYLRGIVEEQNHIISKLKGSNEQASLTQSPSATQALEVVENTEDNQPIALDVPERVFYQEAYRLVSEQRYPQAIKKLQQYLWQYPEGMYVANAHYWLGEIYNAQWQADKSNILLLDKASASFQSIVKNFPDHHKNVDALLKLGFIELEKGNQPDAKNYLDQVAKKYPESASARLANAKLNTLQ